MSSFRKRFGELTVEQARELNEAARWYCEHEVTSEAGMITQIKKGGT